MKNFSHPGSEEKRLIDVNEAIESTAIVSRNEWRYIAELRLELAAGLPLVPCHAAEFNQALLNILVNAAHAIREKFPEGSLGEVCVRTSADSACVAIEIEDNGPGMSPEVQRRIFEPFFTTKEVGRGTGQGLAIAYSTIVDQHSGTLDVESVLGEGTRFRITLPCE